MPPGSDTIAAIATAPGDGAVALLRVSGSKALEVLGRLYRGALLRPRQQQCGQIWAGGRKVDDVLACYFPGPRSYTGEDVVEIGCHGGAYLTGEILRALLESGARAALPGEFTQRAFLSGKMDLTQAEAVMDLISAQGERALRSASEQLEGRLGRQVREIQEAVIGLLAHVEAYIDFPEEDIDPDTGQRLLERMSGAEQACRELLATAGTGRLIREGVRTAICGAPNVGKSSLLNLLLGQDRALVSERPGTTRDVIEEAVRVGGYVLRLADTAGIREAEDEIERAGIERTRRQLDQADLVLEVMDASRPMDQQPALPQLAGLGTEREIRVVRILNKVDLGEHPSWGSEGAVRVSCVRGTGVSGADGLEQALVRALGIQGSQSSGVSVNARHADCLRRTLEALVAARSALGEGLSPEFVAEELRAALDAAGEILGRTEADDILGRIFSSFCIGK
jgi:tRNA modification GTPase